MISYPNIDPILISIGPINVRWYGLAYLFGIVLPFIVFRKSFKHELKFSFDDMLNYINYLIIGVILGGRIGYILFYDFQDFMGNPLILFQIWKGGMSYHGGLFGCILSTVLFAKTYKIQTLRLLDVLAHGSTIGIFFGRLANFINGELYGRITESQWGMIFPTGGPHPRHASQLYEAFFEGFVLFIVLFLIKRMFKLEPGVLGCIYLIFYGLFRYFIEFFREPDSHIGLFLNYFSRGQILCIFEIVSGIIILSLIIKYRRISQK